MKNDKEKRKLILIIVVVLVVINLIVFSILFLNLSQYIWPEKTENVVEVQEPQTYSLSRDGTVTIDGITYKKKDDGNFSVISVDKNIVTADIRSKINESDTVMITEIGEKAFEDCVSLTGVTIPSSVTKIGDSAFANCSKLNNITIPNNVSEIGKGCFANCKALTNIKVHVSNEKYKDENGVLYSLDGKTLYAYPYSKTDEQYQLADSVEKIEDGTFKGFERLKTVAIPTGMKEIGESAFEDCKNLEAVFILKNVEKIGNNAFKNCKEGITIYGEQGSYAETYANENEIAFKLTREWPGYSNAKKEEVIDIGEGNNTNTTANTTENTTENTIANTSNNNTTNNTNTATNTSANSTTNSVANKTQNTNSTLEIEL